MMVEYPHNFLSDLLVDSELLEPLTDDEIMEVLSERLELLTEREKIVLDLRYEKNYTFKQIGEHFGFGVSYASYVNRLTLRKLRSFLNKCDLLVRKKFL